MYRSYAVGVWTTKEHEMSETRETVNADIYQAISGLVGDIASGREEKTRSFSQKNSRHEFFCEKDKKVPCCRRRSGLQIWHQAETSATA
jgi:hypothetical protein